MKIFDYKLNKVKNMKNLISVFADTKNHCKNDEELVQSINNTINNQYIVAENENIAYTTPENKFDKPANIVVSAKRSFQAAEEYRGSKTCVLNFASARNPGGGVITGSSAQEECLCRCSTLYFAISDEKIYLNFHKKHDDLIKQKKMNLLYNSDCIFSPDITVFKSDDGNYTLLPENERYFVDVISCAAPNLSWYIPNEIKGEETKIDPEKLKNLHKSRARRILDIAKANGEESLILGAFGCGVFRNPPYITAQAWAETLSDYMYSFKNIEFAVYCNPSKPSKNYIAFNEVITKAFC